MEKELHYKDIQLIPNYCVVDSRKACKTNMAFGDHEFRLPVILANMRTVMTPEISVYLASNQYFYIMHRFNIDNFEFVKDMNDRSLNVSISVGVNEDSYSQLENIRKSGMWVHYICIDVAHAFCEKVKKMLEYLRLYFPRTFIIAGNICTRQAALALNQWGAHCVKAGIACGSVCVTREKTGFGRPMVSTLLDLQDLSFPIISDGGCEKFGDIAKSLTLGATAVMSGHLFAGHEETAGSTIEIDGRLYKEYYGSASQYNKGRYENVEGKKILVNYKGAIAKTLKELQEDIQSSISYAGGSDLSAFKNVKWVIQ